MRTGCGIDLLTWNCDSTVGNQSCIELLPKLIELTQVTLDFRRRCCIRVPVLRFLIEGHRQKAGIKSPLIVRTIRNNVPNHGEFR